MDIDITYGPLAVKEAFITKNTPIQIYGKFQLQKLKIFIHKRKKNNVYPCKLQFYYMV